MYVVNNTCCCQSRARIITALWWGTLLDSVVAAHAIQGCTGNKMAWGLKCTGKMVLEHWMETIFILICMLYLGQITLHCIVKMVWKQ